MKLLGWMHRKFSNGHSSTHPLGDFSAVGPTCNCLAGRPSPDDLRQHLVNPTPPVEGRDWIFQEPNFGNSFEGLLAIGTFGSPVAMMPATEKQHITEMEEIADKQTEEMTENDLIVVKAELEKEMGYSGDIKISTSLDVTGDKECPLQGSLLGLPSTGNVGRESCKNGRASLGELFKRSREEEELLLVMDKVEGISGKGINGKMKKMLKRRRSGRGNTVAATESNKLSKILKIFHKKIYPETAADSSNYVTPSQPEKEKVCFNNYYNRKLLYDNGSTAQQSFDEGEGAVSIPNPQPSKSLCKNKSKNREQWIKTDADCKCSFVHLARPFFTGRSTPQQPPPSTPSSKFPTATHPPLRLYRIAPPASSLARPTATEAPAHQHSEAVEAG